MASKLPDDYWIEIPGGKYVVGLLPAEAKHLAEQSAAWFRHHGPEWSINDNKLLGRALVLEEKQGNPAWAEQYLLAHFPAREVEIAPFAIARYPVTNERYRRFMAETGECVEPNSWNLGAPFTDDDRPLRGVAWAATTAFAEWAGARLPFEDEWERAVRGWDRWLFPWGNNFAPLGWDILDDEGPTLWTVDATISPERVSGALIGMGEWCADLWTEPSGIDRGHWGEIVPSPGARVTRGRFLQDKVICAGAVRSPLRTTDYDNKTAGIRLVRDDGRALPPPDPNTPVVERQHSRVRTFEVHAVVPTLERLRETKIVENHTIDIDHSDRYNVPGGDPGAQSVKVAAQRGCSPVRWGPPDGPAAYVYGMFLTAVSRETIRRIPAQHGVFVWNIQYRYAEDGRVLARSVTAYHMAFDKAMHKMMSGFRTGEVETPIDELTPALIERAILDAFWFYERFADSDRSPF